MEEKTLYKTTEYQMMYKDKEGEAHIVDLLAQRFRHGQEATLSDFISQAEPVIINPIETKATRHRHERVIILPDIQTGYRRYEDGQLKPIHSEEALSVALQVIREAQPDRIIMNGDNIDFTTISKHLPEHHFTDTLQPSINRVHKLLAEIRSNAPNAHLVYIAGNHEQRLEKYIATHAPELYELRQADSDKRLLTIPFLLNLDAIGNCQYISGYPASEYWLSDDIRVMHGYKVRQGGGATAAAVLRAETTSTIYGHIHRAEMAKRTIATRYGGKIIVAASFGCLADIQGAVPSYGSAVDDDGQPMKHIEDWQQGLGYLEIERKTGRLALCEMINIDTFNGHQATFRNKTYKPSI